MASVWTTLARALKPLADQSLHDLCTIRRAVRGRVVGGGISETWANVGIDIPCRIASASTPQGETLLADQMSALKRWNVTMPLGTPVAEGDYIDITGTDILNDTDDSNTWPRTVRVVGVPDPATYEVLRLAVCIDVTPDGR